MLQRYGDKLYFEGKGRSRIKRNKEIKILKACERLRAKIDKSSRSEIEKLCGHGHINIAEINAKSKLKNYRPKDTLKSYKKIPHDKLKNIILGYIYNTKDEYITKEEVSIKCNVKEHFVEEIFKELNREGILSQRHSSYAHDTNRNYMFSGSESGWASDKYYILKCN